MLYPRDPFASRRIIWMVWNTGILRLYRIGGDESLKDFLIHCTFSLFFLFGYEFENCREMSYWSLLEQLPKGLDIAVVRAENSDRWSPQVLQQLESLAKKREGSENGKVSFHVLPNSGHWVHVDNPKGLLEIIAPNIVSMGWITSNLNGVGINLLLWHFPGHYVINFACPMWFLCLVPLLIVLDPNSNFSCQDTLLSKLMLKGCGIWCDIVVVLDPCRFRGIGRSYSLYLSNISTFLWWIHFKLSSVLCYQNWLWKRLLWEPSYGIDRAINPFIQTDKSFY